MKAMIFAAGLGTRLRPLTDRIPKAMVRVNGMPLLDLAITKLSRAGFTDIIINVHHFAGHIFEYLSEAGYENVNVTISDESDLLLDTGGGLKKASWFFDDGHPILVYNVDVLIRFDLKALLAHHQASKAMATLAVSDRVTSRYLLFDEAHQMKGWVNTATGQVKPPGLTTIHLHKYAFSGIHVIEPELLQHIRGEGPFSLIDSYIGLCGQHPISCFIHRGDDWIDVGKPEILDRLEQQPPDERFFT